MKPDLKLHILKVERNKIAKYLASLNEKIENETKGKNTVIVKPGTNLIHHSGRKYKVIYVIKDKTGITQVVYEGVINKKLWIRPLFEFEGKFKNI